MLMKTARFLKYNRRQHRKASKEAKDWVMRIKSGQVTPETATKCHEWMAENPLNMNKFDMLYSLWDASDTLKDHPLTAEILNKKMGSQASIPEKSWLGNLIPPLPAMRTIAVAVTVVFVVVGVLLMQRTTTSPRMYQTAIAEQKQIHLKDGSTIVLDTDTTVLKMPAEDLRQFELVKGRALFIVAHDPARPFIVNAGEITIRAIGTEFNVYRTPEDKVLVSVSEGKVRIDRKQKPMPSTEPVETAAPADVPKPEQPLLAYKLDQVRHLA